MDEMHFDDLTRSLAVPSRRGLLAAFATAIAALVGGDADQAHGKRKRRKQAKRNRNESRDRQDRLEAERRKKRKRKKKRRPDTAAPSPPPPPTGDCTPTCAGKACGASDGCGGICLAGSCPSGQLCQNGQCVSSCSSGLTQCGSQCVDTQRNASHCGGCDQPCVPQAPETCGTTGECWAGVCLKHHWGTSCGPSRCVDACSYEFRECDGAGHCMSGLGGCAGGRCNSATGWCDFCSAHDQCCDGEWCDGRLCQPKKADGATCGAPAECTSGYCVGGICCSAACVAPPNTTPSCPGGTCGTLTCQEGFDDCDGDMGNGCETDLMNDSVNCGACGSRCADRPQCPSGDPQTCAEGSCGCHV